MCIIWLIWGEVNLGIGWYDLLLIVILLGKNLKKFIYLLFVIMII